MPPVPRRVPRAGRVLVPLFLGFSSPLAAQEVFGTLRQLETGAPAAGVIVTASLAANDSTVGRTITGARGTYTLRVVDAPVILRVLRVGQQPFELARLTVAAGTRQEASAALPDIPVRLAIVDARVDTRCRVNPVNGTLVAQLFHEARKALWASRLAASERPAASRLRQTVQQFDARERPVGEPFVSEGVEHTLRPFASVDVGMLLEHGFREITGGDAMIYHAPDAEVLTDDRFLAEHCIRLSPDSTSHPEWLGVAFEPARARRGVVQVRGTVWLDRRSHELRSIEYGYRGLEPALARATPGGVVEYTHLPNGVWFVDTWSIRMPRVTAFTRRTLNAPELEYVVVSGVQVTSGQVLELFDDGELVFTTGDDAVAPSADALVTPLISLRDDTECDTTGVDTPDVRTAAADTFATVSGVLRDASGQPLAGVLVRATWTETIRTGELDKYNVQYYDEDRELFTHTGPDGVFHLCDLPRRVRIQVAAGPAERAVARTTIRLRRDARSTVITLSARAGR